MKLDWLYLTFSIFRFHSEIRLIEVLESVCERVLEYNIHAERKDSRRYSMKYKYFIGVNVCC